MNNGNLKLWKVVSTTDPANTTRVNHRGGFTAICAQSQVKAATEQFGVYGIGWGIQFDSDEYIRDGSGNILEYVYKGTLWFLLDGERGVLPCQSSIKYKAGDDVQMKAETHARSKALSKLGFNADVYEGRFDDNKFVTKRLYKTTSNNGTSNGKSNGVAKRYDHDKAVSTSRALRDLRSACLAAGVTTEQKREFIAQWVTKYSVDSFERLSVTQIEQCINEIKQLKESGAAR
jgi:hypothetical protein